MELSSEMSAHHHHDGDSSMAPGAGVSAPPSATSAAEQMASASMSAAAPAAVHEDDGGGGGASPSSSASDPASVAANAIDVKKTGRPVHPLWAHFHRGEKRNRYHYHAFCIYCVARYGAEHVPPTRGVSIDMLRHVEKCVNCPPKVVESVKDICGRRDAVRFDRYLKKKTEAGGDDVLNHEMHQQHGGTGASDGGVQDVSAHQLQQQQQQQQQQSSDRLREVQAHQAHQQQQQLLHAQQQQQFQQQQHDLDKSHPHGDALANESTGEAQKHHSTQQQQQQVESSSSSVPVNLSHSNHAMEAVMSSAASRSAVAAASSARLVGKHALQTAGFVDHNQSHTQQQQRQHAARDHETRDTPGSSSTKRARTSAGGSSAEWKISLLKTAVTAGVPFQAFENAEFQELLRVLNPAAAAMSSGSSRSVEGTPLNSLRERKFLSEATSRLALVQLDRVKEGMHNSTIKGGLTLSVNCWSTLDLQQLVAFTLVNSNGDASCVCVVDMGTQANAYSSTQLAIKIEDVLQKLEELRICVMGIVADSVIALNAARCVCFAEKRKSLLVVPCLTRQLSVLAGSLLTHELFCDAVGQMIEVASYFSNASLQNMLRLVSGDDEARIPMPNRANWYSFLECISAMLKYCDIVTAICSEADSSGGNDNDESVAGLPPQRLKDLVFADEGKLWKTLQELHTLLLPLKETYVLVFQNKLKGEPSPSSDPNSSEAERDTPSGANDFFVAAHGLTLAHIMYQLARMNQQYAGLVGTHHEPLAQMMQARINITWQRYDLPVMVLAYVFNFHLDTALLNMTHEAFQWESIAVYFQTYFSTWFQRSGGDDEIESGARALAARHPSHGSESTSSTTSVGANSTSSSNGDATNPALGPISSDKVHEIFSAYKLNQFPFDADTTSDYVDVSSFYSFVSDSHPEICALCCRMYAIALLSANVQRIVRGIGYVPTTQTQTVKSPETVEFLLHVGFASSAKSVRRAQVSASKHNASNSSNVITEFTAVLDGCHPDEIFWNENVWDEFASDWRQFLELELATEEFDAISTHISSRNSGSDGRVSGMVLRKVPLDEVFVGTLAPLSSSGPSSSTTASSVANPGGHDDTVLSMEM